jgi:ribosomal protein S18 acetylase RimI-like enzyme
LNEQPEHHIVYFGTTPQEIEHYLLEEQSIPPEESYLKAYYDGELTGVIGLEYDLDLKRAWIEGPLIQGAHWVEIADELYAAVLNLIPESINDYELACDARHIYMGDFSAKHGYYHNGDAALLIFQRSNLTGLPEIHEPQLDEGFAGQMQRLHDQLFPGTYYSGKQLLGKIDQHHKIFMVAKAKSLLGYIFVYVSPSIGDAYIDFIGVKEEVRRQGYGKRLLVSALHWIFSFPEVNQVGLTVRVENDAAVKMYEDSGFICERTLRGYRKKFA